MILPIVCRKMCVVEFRMRIFVWVCSECCVAHMTCISTRTVMGSTDFGRISAFTVNFIPGKSCHLGYLMKKNCLAFRKSFCAAQTLWIIEVLVQSRNFRFERWVVEIWVQAKVCSSCQVHLFYLSCFVNPKPKNVYDFIQISYSVLTYW